MGKYLTLINEKIEKVAQCEFWKQEDGQPITSEAARFKKIEALTQSGRSIKLWSNTEFQVEFDHETLTVYEGENICPPLFAVWLMTLYGENQHYGELAKLRGFSVTDENPDGEIEEEKPKAVKKPKKVEPEKVE